MIRLVFELITAVLALGGIAYYALCMAAARAFLKRKLPASTFTPPTSVLKPIRGADPRTYECFRSHCLQDYPQYEIIFGVNDATDPALPLIERLVREFPEQRIRLVICSEVMGTNKKISSLIQMLRYASYHFVLINDSDICVSRDYLRSVVSPLEDTRIGVVTALYRGIPGRTIWSKLESLNITEFVASVVMAYRFAPEFHYGFGSTLCVPRKVLNEAGGFEALADYLADDYQLATNVVAAGYRVFLSHVIVETMLPDYSLRDFWTHQLRWARTVRDASRLGYAGLSLTRGVEWALVAVAVSGAAIWAWILLVVAAALRIASMMIVAKGISHETTILRRLWLLSLRILDSAAVWVVSWLGNTVVWRGEKFVLRRGKLRAVQSTPAAQASTSTKKANSSQAD